MHPCSPRLARPASRPNPAAALTRALTLCLAWCLLLGLHPALRAQSLMNVSFGAGATSAKTGFAGTGQATNDFWNLYRHYEPRFTPGTPPVPNGRLENLKRADGTVSTVTVAVTNAPGVWGNATGDALLDSYVFAPNGSNLVVTVTGLDPGRYHFLLYGWAAADVAAEQNSVFTLQTAGQTLGPLAASGAAGWQAGQPWRERAQYVIFRDVAVEAGQTVTFQVAPGAGGVAVLNGLQILSRGTGAPRLTLPATPPPGPDFTNLLLREIRYTGRIDDAGAVFQVTLDAESRSTNEVSALVFEGEAAVLQPKLPPGWRLIPFAHGLRLAASTPGSNRLEFELRPRVQRAEPWQQFSLTGPAAAIATVTATADRPDLEVQLLAGTSLAAEDLRTNTVRGVLGADRKLALRWQGRTTEVTREAVLAADTQIEINLTPSAARFTTEIRYEVLQGRQTRLRLALPPEQTLIRVEADALRDWRVESLDRRQIVNLEFLRPMEGTVKVTVLTEQATGALPGDVVLQLPGPLEVQRENGTLRVRAQDVLARFDAAEGLRQVNAGTGEAAAYRFNARPALLRVHLSRVEPELTVASRVTGRLEDTRFRVRHQWALTVARAGIYGLEAVLPTGFKVTAVKTDGLEDWQAEGGRLRLQFAQRLLGSRTVEVDLEQAFTTIPATLTLTPLRPVGAARETAFIGAVALPGLELKTGTLTGARELPVTALPGRSDELLAFRADRPDWSVILQASRQEARVVADVFNLITVGDGVLGGSATLRFALINQGLQQFRVRVPTQWRNVEFTGANLRRQDRQEDVWTLALQDKVWNAYTLVVTYDGTFDPKVGAVDLAGAHAPDAERETGTVAVTAAPGLTLTPGPLTDPLRALDPAELADSDRALISRPVLHAARYAGTNYAWNLQATRHDQLDLLDAVADRAQLTSVVTAAGEMLTSASFMVKNSERQFQRFRLPPGATLWGVAVNGEPSKADQDDGSVVIALPRSEDRDRTFAIDLKYAQSLGPLGRWWPRRIALQAPSSDLAGTYAEWQLYVPNSRRVSNFEGSMTVARGTTYGLGEAWDEFTRTYRRLWSEWGGAFLVVSLILGFTLAAVILGRRRGLGGLVRVLVVTLILGVLAGMLLPSLAKAKAKAGRIKSVNNLKNIGLAARIFSTDNSSRMPNSLDEIANELGSPQIRIDPMTGQEYTWVGAGKSEEDPNAILAYSSSREGGREVLLADGSVQQVTESRFQEMVAADEATLSPQLALRYGLMSQSAPSSRAAGAPQAATPPTQAPNGAVGGPGGTTPLAPGQPARPPGANPMAVGLRSLQIDIPRAGRALQFTRVLNLKGEAASVEFSVMSARVHAAGETLLQVAAFLLGLFLIWRQWRRPVSSTLWLTVGVALALFGLTQFLVTWRALHLALILGAPTLALVLLLTLLWPLLRRTPRSSPPPPPVPPTPDFPAPLATVLWLVGGLWLATPCAEAQALTNLASVVQATYQGTAGERAAVFEARLDFVSAGTQQNLSLFGPEVAVQEFTVTSGDAQLWREGDHVGVRLPQRGAASIRARFLVRIDGDITRRRLEFDLPPALASRVELTVPEPDADLDFPSAVSLRRRTETNTTHVEAVLGPVPRLNLSWTPRIRRAAEVTVNAFGQQATRITLAGGVVALHGIHTLHAAQGELQQLRLQIPEGQRLLRITGDTVRGWDYVAGSRQTLVVDLLKPAADARLVVETEATLETLPAVVTLSLPRFLGLQRESGTVAVHGSDELGFTTADLTGLERIEPAEFTTAAGADPGPLFSAWRFDQPEPRLGLRVETLQPRLEATTRHQFTVGSDQSTLAVQVQLDIKRAGIFQLRLPLPEGWRLDAVRSPTLRDWNERVDDGRPSVEVVWKERTLGRVELALDLSQVRSNLPPRLNLGGLSIPGLAREEGVVSVATEPGVSVKTAGLSGLTEIPAATLGRPPAPGTTLLAFQFVRTGLADTNRWALGLETEQLAAVVRAETVQFTTVSETLLSGRTLVKYTVENAPVQEFRLRVPATWRNVDVQGVGIRRRDQTAQEWRVELQNKVRGDYLLSVTWDAPREAGTNALTLEGLVTVGTEREAGTVALLTSGQLQLTALNVENLTRTDTGEVPAWARTAGNPVQAYRYARAGWRLPVEVRRFAEAAVLQVLIEQVQLRTVLADHGEAMTQLQLRLRNNGRQNLRVRLPAGARVWSAFVAGEPVRPAREGDALLLPLEGVGADAPATVELTYVAAGQFPRLGGKIQLESPRFDAPLKDARWELLLPPDYDYDGFGGSMGYDASELAPVVQDFTFAEYARQAVAQSTTDENDQKGALSQAKKEIAAGNYAVVERLTQNRLRSGKVRDAGTRSELQQLETQLNEAQSSNLIQGQNLFANQNPWNNGFPDRGQVQELNSIPTQAQNRAAGNGFANQAAGPGTNANGSGNGDYDARVAEQQVMQLRKAQAVAVVRVQPLRVTLPTRGIRQAFAQVLQTDSDQALTVSLRARSTRSTGWGTRLLLGASGLAVLWMACGFALSRRDRQPAQP